MTDISVATAAAKVVRVGILSGIGKIDPREAFDSISGLVLGQIFETPYALAAGQTSATPLLFEPLRQEGRLQYSAAVRPNIRFSDGTPLTAQLAAQSLRTAKVLDGKAAVDVRDDRVWFTLDAPNPRFDLTLTQDNTAIVLERGAQLFGTGAFMFDQRPNLRLLQSASEIRLVRNPHYHGSTAIDELRFRVWPADDDGTPRQLIEALRHGEADVTTALTLADLTTHQLSLSPSMQPGNSTGILFFNTERRFLSEPAVRRAIALALDLHEIASRSYDKNPAAFIAASLLPPMMGRETGLPASDRAEARRILDRGGSKPARLSLLVPWAPRPYLPKPLPVAHAIQKQLGEIGIAVDLLETKTGEEFFNDLTRGNYDMALAGWIADTPDPADFFEALLWSKMTANEQYSNHSRWRNAEMDAALARFRDMPSEGNKREVHRIVRDEAPLVPLIYGQSVVLHARKMRNVTQSATGVLTLAGVTVSA